jgi:hypothetical protein
LHTLWKNMFFSISGFVMSFNISLILKVSVEFILILFCGAFVHVAIFIKFM